MIQWPKSRFMRHATRQVRTEGKTSKASKASKARKANKGGKAGKQVIK